MKTKKFISVLMATIIMLSTIICSMPTTSAAIKSGNKNESNIESNVYPAHYIHGNDNVTPKYQSQITEANGWQINTLNSETKKVITAQVSISGLRNFVNSNNVVKNLVDDPITVTNFDGLKKALTSTIKTTNGYRYINITKNIELTSDITVNKNTIIYINSNNSSAKTLNCNKKDIHIKGDNVLISGDGFNDENTKKDSSGKKITVGPSQITNGQIIVDENDVKNIAIKNLKLTNNSTYPSTIDTNKIVFNKDCSNISITGCAINNYSTDKTKNNGKGYGGRVYCNASVENLYVLNCKVGVPKDTSLKPSPYFIRTSSNGSISKLKISRSDDNTSTLYGLSSLINSNNIKITNQDNLNYSFADCNTISFTKSSINNIAFNGCNTFRLHSTNINGYCSIKGCNKFSLIDVPITGEANFNDSYYFEFDRAKVDETSENDCLNNVLNSGLNLTNCRNFIINEARIPVGLNIINNTSNNYAFFSIKNSYVNNVTIKNMQNFTIYKTCKKKTPKNYTLSNCKLYKNYVVRTSSANAQRHGH